MYPWSYNKLIDKHMKDLCGLASDECYDGYGNRVKKADLLERGKLYQQKQEKLSTIAAINAYKPWENKKPTLKQESTELMTNVTGSAGIVVDCL